MAICKMILQASNTPLNSYRSELAGVLRPPNVFKTDEIIFVDD
jgi:hypothetical protein